MEEAGGRRIKRAIYLDQSSIRFLTSEEIGRLSRFCHLETYLQRKSVELKEWNGRLGEKGKIGANTRRITNVGTLRAYVEAYLRDPADTPGHDAARQTVAAGAGRPSA